MAFDHGKHERIPASEALEALEALPDAPPVRAFAYDRVDDAAWPILTGLELDSLDIGTLRAVPDGWAEARWKQVTIQTHVPPAAFAPPPAGCERLRASSVTALRTDAGWRLELPGHLHATTARDVLAALGEVHELVLKGPYPPR